VSTSELFLGVAYILAVGWLWYDLGRKVEGKRFAQSVCHHVWDYRSLDNLDHYWQRVCLACKLYEKLEREEVPYHERCKARNFPPLDG
jgi:hypothetical protein